MTVPLGFIRSDEFTCVVFEHLQLILMYHIYLVELLVVGSINLTILYKMYQYRVNIHTHRQPRCLNAEFCSCFPVKYKETIFISVVFIVPLLLPSAGVILSQHLVCPWQYLPAPFFYMSFAFTAVTMLVDMILSILSIVVLANWTWKLKRKSLLNNKMKLVCKEMSFIISFLTGFILIFVTIVLSGFFLTITISKLLLALAHGVAPVLFLVYIYTKKRRTKPLNDS